MTLELIASPPPMVAPFWLRPGDRVLLDDPEGGTPPVWATLSDVDFAGSTYTLTVSEFPKPDWSRSYPDSHYLVVAPSVAERVDLERGAA